MKSECDPISADCPVCGTPLVRHRRDGFCSRCLARTSLLEDISGEGDEATLDRILPSGPDGSDDGLRVRLGDFELLEELARGGMGVVFRARQVSLDRIVAVKMLLFGGWGGPEALRRFRTEAAAAGALEHPNIIRVLDVGEHDGQPFIAMQYLAGCSLADAARERVFPGREAAGCVARIARAIDYAHHRGVLHRDLKPSNILLDAKGEPHVTDFGLAKIIKPQAPDANPDSALDLTFTNQALGSPNYAPPEQAGAGHAADVHSDVYGLGAILYHLLTGRPPFQGASPVDVLAQVREREPVPPRQLDPSVPRDLETLCLKCLEKEPARRYQTAQELADELDRFLRDEPIHARPVSHTERAWRWCRRKPALAGALAAAVLFLIAGLAGVLWQWRAAQSHATAATQAATRAEANALTARRAQYASDMNLAHQAVQDGDFFRARQLLERYRSQESGVRSKKLEVRS